MGWNEGSNGRMECCGKGWRWEPNGDSSDSEGTVDIECFQDGKS